LLLKPLISGLVELYCIKTKDSKITKKVSATPIITDFQG
jgi:hypothetical protein